MEDDFVQVGEAAKILGRHFRSVLNYEKSGLLPVALRQPVTNNRLWPRTVVEELAERLKIREPIRV